MRRALPAGVLLAAALAGCVSTRAHLLIADPYLPVPEAEVRVLASRSALPEGCTPLVVIRARGDVDLTTGNQMIAAARRRAARLGANTLVVDQIRDPHAATQLAAVLFGTPDPRRGRMLGLRCPREDPGETGAEPRTRGQAAPGSISRYQRSCTSCGSEGYA